MQINKTLHVLLWLAITAQWVDGASAACHPGLAESPVVVAHRGSTTRHPENTLQAFGWAAQIGADMIELDIRFNADGQPVVMHDEAVDRTTNGRGNVGELSLAQLLALDAGDAQSIPTLDTALAFARETRMPLLLDLKDSQPDVDQVIDAVRSHGLAPRVTIGAHSIPVLRAVRQAPVAMATLAFAPKKAAINAYLEEGADIVRLWAKWLQREPQLLENIRSAGACAWVTTGRLQGRRLRRIMEHGVGGLITDYPQTALQLRAALRMGP